MAAFRFKPIHCCLNYPWHLLRLRRERLKEKEIKEVEKFKE